MQKPFFNRSALSLTLILALVAGAIGTFAYSEPTAQFPANTTEPIDTSLSDQAKAGGLSVFAFFARGNADFKQDLTIEGVAQGGNPGDTQSMVQIASNTLVTGQLFSNDHLSAQTLQHGDPTPKPVCGDSNGIVVFCPTIAGPDMCLNLTGQQDTVPAGYTRDGDGNCFRVLKGTVQLVCGTEYGTGFGNSGNVIVKRWSLRDTKAIFTFDQPVLPNTKILVGAMSYGVNTHPAEGPDLPMWFTWGRSIIPTSIPTPTPTYTNQAVPFTVTIPTSATTYTAYPLMLPFPTYREVFYCAGLSNQNALPTSTPLDKYTPKRLILKLAPDTGYDRIEFTMFNNVDNTILTNVNN